MKLYIYALSQHRKYVEYSLIDKSDPMDEHIIRLLLYYDNSLVKPWIREIWSFIHKVERLKSNNRYPSYNFIYNAISSHNDIVRAMINGVKDEEYNLVPHEISLAAAVAALEEYQKWLARYLSVEGEVPYKDAEVKLLEIIDLYKDK